MALLPPTTTTRHPPTPPTTEAPLLGGLSAAFKHGDGVGSLKKQLKPGSDALRQLFVLPTGAAYFNASYGNVPIPVMQAQWALQVECESDPQAWMLGGVATKLRRVRSRLARYVRCETEDLVLVENCTAAANAVLRSLPVPPGSVLIHLSTAYGIIKNGMAHAAAAAGARVVEVPVEFHGHGTEPRGEGGVPLATAVASVIEEAHARGEGVALACFDHIASCPGALMPVVELPSSGAPSVADSSVCLIWRGRVRHGASPSCWMARTCWGSFPSTSARWRPRACTFGSLWSTHHHPAACAMSYSALSVAGAVPPSARHCVAFRVLPKSQSLPGKAAPPSQAACRSAHLLSDCLPTARRSVLLRAAEPEEASTADSKPAAEPKLCKEAINAGLELYRNKQFKEAIVMWQKSLEMPGSGAMRMSGTVREFSCPSEGEENAALYNMACAYSQLGETQSALTCIKGALENGFDDYQALRKDADLASIQGNALEEVIGKFEKPVDKLNAFLGRSKKQKDSGTNKPWLLW